VTNIQVKAYALLQGMSIIISLGIKELVIIRYSRIIVKSLIFKEPMKHLQLALIVARAIKLTQKLKKLTIYHVLLENNGKTDTLAREASSMPQGLIRKWGGQFYPYILRSPCALPHKK